MLDNADERVKGKGCQRRKDADGKRQQTGHLPVGHIALPPYEYLVKYAVGHGLML